MAAIKVGATLLHHDRRVIMTPLLHERGVARQTEERPRQAALGNRTHLGQTGLRHSCAFMCNLYNGKM